MYAYIYVYMYICIHKDFMYMYICKWYIYIFIYICIHLHIYRIHRPAARAKGSAATGLPWSLYVVPSSIHLFVFVARVSEYHFMGLC